MSREEFVPLSEEEREAIKRQVLEELRKKHFRLTYLQVQIVDQFTDTAVKLGDKYIAELYGYTGSILGVFGYGAINTIYEMCKRGVFKIQQFTNPTTKRLKKYLVFEAPKQ